MRSPRAILGALTLAVLFVAAAAATEEGVEDAWGSAGERLQETIGELSKLRQEFKRDVQVTGEEVREAAQQFGGVQDGGFARREAAEPLPRQQEGDADFNAWSSIERKSAGEDASQVQQQQFGEQRLRTSEMPERPLYGEQQQQQLGRPQFGEQQQQRTGYGIQTNEPLQRSAQFSEQQQQQERPQPSNTDEASVRSEAGPESFRGDVTNAHADANEVREDSANVEQADGSRAQRPAQEGEQMQLQDERAAPRAMVSADAPSDDMRRAEAAPDSSDVDIMKLEAQEVRSAAPQYAAQGNQGQPLYAAQGAQGQPLYAAQGAQGQQIAGEGAERAAPRAMVNADAPPDDMRRKEEAGPDNSDVDIMKLEAKLEEKLEAQEVSSAAPQYAAQGQQMADAGAGAQAPRQQVQQASEQAMPARAFAQSAFERQQQVQSAATEGAAEFSQQPQQQQGAFAASSQGTSEAVPAQSAFVRQQQVQGASQGAYGTASQGAATQGGFQGVSSAQPTAYTAQSSLGGMQALVRQQQVQQDVNAQVQLVARQAAQQAFSQAQQQPSGLQGSYAAGAQQAQYASDSPRDTQQQPAAGMQAQAAATAQQPGAPGGYTAQGGSTGSSAQASQGGSFSSLSDRTEDGGYAGGVPMRTSDGYQIIRGPANADSGMGRQAEAAPQFASAVGSQGFGRAL